MDSREYIACAVLKNEIQLLKSRIQPEDTGHLHTTIAVLEHRIKEREKKVD